MASDPQDVTLAVLGSKVDQLTLSVTALQQSMTQHVGELVTRREWLLRNENVDTRFRDHGREIGDLRTELRSKSIPWTSVVATLASAAALLVSLDVIGPQ